LGSSAIRTFVVMKLRRTPCWKGYSEVKIEAVDGAVQDEGAHVCSKRIDRLAIEARKGVSVPL